MRKLLIFAVFDAAAEAFMQPFFLQSKGQALRGFTDAVNDESTQINKHPEDYTLFHLGFFNEETGDVEPLGHIDKLVSAFEVVDHNQNDRLEAARRPELEKHG